MFRRRSWLIVLFCESIKALVDGHLVVGSRIEGVRQNCQDEKGSI